MNRYLGSIIRHILTMLGGALFAHRNESSIDTAVAIAIAAIGAGWSVAKARVESTQSTQVTKSKQ